MTRPLRVGHLTTVASSLRYLLEAQLVGTRDAGYEVVGISAPGEDVPYVEALGVRHVALPSSTRLFSLRADLKAIRDLRRVLRELDLDVLHTHNPKPGLYGRVLGRLSGIPHVVNTVHGLYAMPEDRLAKRALVYGAEAVAARFSHAELIQNEEDLSLLARLRITPKRKLVHLGNGVDLTRFTPVADAAERESVRVDLGLERDAVIVGIVARLVEEKGLRELFAAAAELRDHATFVVIGPHDPERPDSLDPDVVARAVDDGVLLVGHQEDTAQWYRAMDVFVLPSYREGVPRGAMEAAASGLPIVTTDVRGCRQVVAHGDNGLLVPARDAVALEAALRELVTDPQQREVMGLAGRRRAEQLFDERDVVQRVLRCYDGLGAAAVSTSDVNREAQR